MLLDDDNKEMPMCIKEIIETVFNKENLKIDIADRVWEVKTKLESVDSKIDIIDNNVDDIKSSVSVNSLDNARLTNAIGICNTKATDAERAICLSDWLRANDFAR